MSTERTNEATGVRHTVSLTPKGAAALAVALPAVLEDAVCLMADEAIEGGTELSLDRYARFELSTGKTLIAYFRGPASHVEISDLDEHQYKGIYEEGKTIALTFTDVLVDSFGVPLPA